MDTVDTIILSNILNPMLPITMLLRVYSFGVLILDVSWVMLNAMLAIVEAFFIYLMPPPLKSVKDEVVMIVGSGRGVGQDIAIQMALRGARVLCVDHNETNNAKTVAFINRKGGDAHSFICDITKKKKVDKLVEEIKKEGNVVTMLFYCCGIPSPRSLMSQPPQDIHETLDLTLTAFIWLINHFLPEMKEKNHGHIIALTSVAGLSYLKEYMPLSVAQFGVQGLAESLLEDMRVNKITNVHVSLIHIYPFIVDQSSEFRLKIPSYFGTITPTKAARSILDIVLRNTTEGSVPDRMLFLGRLLRFLPRKATVLIRDLLDTGVDFV